MKLVFVIVLSLAFGCAATFGSHRASGAPTCEAVCDYYTACRGIDHRDTYNACVVECQDIFYEDGKADARSLRQFQRLQCADAIAFVEGTSGRPPGASTRRQERP